MSLPNTKTIYAVGRNWAAHAKELNNAVPKSPFYFLKPIASMLLDNGCVVPPPQCNDLHFEVEMGVVIGTGGRDISAADAMKHVSGYVLALDMTARDLQDAAKKQGLPWSVAKGFGTSCPVSAFVPAAAVPNPHDVTLWLNVDGKPRQRGSTKDMLFNVPTLIAFISSIVALQDGDLILCGTPPGVGAVQAGQTIQAGMETGAGAALASLSVPVIARSAAKSKL